MNVTRGPAVTIRYEVNDDGHYVLQVNEFRIQTRIDSKEKVTELWNMFRPALERFANQLALPPKWQEQWDAFRELAETGVSVMDEMFGHGGPDSFRLEETLNVLYPEWKNEAARPGQFTIVADLDQFLPLELLPLFNTRKLPDTVKSEDLPLAVRRLPCFSTVVRRQLPSITPTRGEDALKLDNFHSLPLRFFWNQDLEGSKSEKEFFERVKGIDLIGPWPDQHVTSNELKNRLAEWLWDASSRVEEKDRHDQVQHFACHCDTDPTTSPRSHLIFRGDEKVTISDIKRGFRDRARPATANKLERDPARRPLVFLNACRSLQVKPGAVTSIPMFFLDPVEGCGSRGVIGTAARVPD